MDDFASLQASIQSNLVATTRSAAQLAAEDLSFHRSLEPKLGSQLDAQNARLLGLVERLVGSATASTEVVRPSLKDIDDVEGNWTKVVDVVDSLLERADTALDEFTGAFKRLLPPKQGTPNTKFSPHATRLAAAFRNQEMEKPQLLFNHPPNNHTTEPFRPLLLEKPHASKALQTSPNLIEGSGRVGFEHPYQQEIEDYTYPPFVYTRADPIQYHPFESTSATMVDTEEALEKMLQDLKSAKEIAIDLEHHSIRSYVGIVCLMQISTRDHDWIVDTLKPWRRKLQCLNQVFADPSVLKVLHGAYMDIIWLQRDLGLYIVGLFDTHYAARALGYPGGSYAFLLKKFTGVDAQKQYQMADWRIRPLPQELVEYARSDTHYLLYIYDNMRDELIERSDFTAPDKEQDKINDVLERSRETALQRYESEVYDFDRGQGPMGWHKLLARIPAMFSKEQFAVFRTIHQWRDTVAREQDDSVSYIMPNHSLYAAAKEMPTSKAQLLGIADTQTLRLRADELLALITNAKEQSGSGPEMMDVLTQIDPLSAQKVALQAGPRTSTGVTSAVKSLVDGRASLGQGAFGLPPTTSTSLPLRTSTSSFWGSSLDQLRPREQRREMSSTSDVQLSIPLPPLTAEVFSEAMSEGTPEQPASQEQVAASAEPIAHVDDEVFVLKEMGKKRKRTEEHAADAMATQSDEVALPDDKAEHMRQKAERKMAKKEKKRAAKAQAARYASNTNGEADEEPFDYASAPSILHQAPGVGIPPGKEHRKQVNPYAKALDTTKGLPRAQRERAGRSMTYSS